MNPYLIIGFLVALLAVGFTGYRVGEKVAKSDYEAAMLKAEQQAAADKAAVEAKATQIETASRTNYQAMLRQNEEARARTVVVYRKIKEEVPVYVTAKADAGCVVTAGFVELFDRAYSPATGDPVAGSPGAGAFDVDRPSGVSLSQVGSVSVDNAEVCHQWEDAARSCRAYVTQVVLPFYLQLQESVHACR